jgi:alpha-L-rhamnosidase
VLLIAAGLIVAATGSWSGPVGATEVRASAPVALTVDGLASPLGVGSHDVQFAWRGGDGGRGTAQVAYRIVVSRVSLAGDEARATATIWDSGRVASADQANVPYRGPSLAADAVHGWTVQTWTDSGRAGPFARPATFETGLADRDWRASWIRRAGDERLEPDQYTYARKEFRLGSSPVVRARAYVSGDQQYELYVNGSRAGKGQAYSFPDSQYYETLDVTRLLRSHALNAVGMLTSWQGATKGHPAGSPGAITQISVLHRDGTRQWIVTDGSWRVAKGAWLPGTQRDLEGDLVDFTENINGPAQPVGWDAPRFDDRQWAPAIVLGPAGVAPWTHLVSVRTRIIEEPIRAVSVTRLPTGAVVADFGRVYAAVPTVRFRHGVRGRVIKMRAGYLLEPAAGQPLNGEPGQVSTQHGTQHTDMSYTYVQRGGVEQFHPFDYLGFRYFQVDNPGETLERDDIVAFARHTVVPDEHAATFTSSNPTVNAVFELGRHSALFSAQEQFVDTPTREKGPWLWDGFNESQTAMAAFGEQNLTRKSLLEFAQSQARYWPNGAVNKIYPTGIGALDINEFTEIYPEWVWQYWLNTGDRTLLAAVYPVVTRVSDYVAASIDRSTGLVTSLPATDIYYSFPVVTRLNVLGANVFGRAADVASALGRPDDEVERQRNRRSALVDAINARLTRPDGVYVDGREANGVQVATASQDTNACAFVYGVVPRSHRAAVAAYVASLGLTAPPRTAGEVLETLALAGRDADLVLRITDPTSDGWASVLARGGTFTWEVWQPSDVIGDSMSHGWGSNVLVEIQRALLGVRVTSAGAATFDVSPPTSGLAWAQGTVPTPRGPVAVHWRRSDDRDAGFALDVTVPAGARATIHLPARAVLEVGAGRYHFESGATTT